MDSVVLTLDFSFWDFVNLHTEATHMYCWAMVHHLYSSKVY